MPVTVSKLRQLLRTAMQGKEGQRIWFIFKSCCGGVGVGVVVGRTGVAMHGDGGLMAHG